MRKTISPEDILKAVNVISLDKNAKTMIFLDRRFVTQEDARIVVKLLNDEGITKPLLFITSGNPHEVVKAVVLEGDK